MKRLINKRRNAERKRNGFTLVELIVVLALIGILLAFSVGGMLGYTNYAQFKRNNESAKAVFNAAQSAISYYKASGKLEELRKNVEDLQQSPLYVPQSAFIEDGEEASAESGARETASISYLMMSKSDDSYQKIEDAVKNGNFPDVDEETKLLFKLLRDYITDVSLYDASICVEFDATDGVVSGVFYCDKDTGFSYGDGEDTLDITKRGESYRRRRGLGYYSTELSDRAPEKVEALKVAGAKLVNAETLDVQWFLEKKYQYLTRMQNYTVTLQDDKDRKLVEIELDANAEHGVGWVSTEGGFHDYVVAKRVTLYDPNDSANHIDLKAPSGSSEGGIRFHAYMVSDVSTDAKKENYGDGLALSLDVTDSYTAEALDEADPAMKEEKLLSTYSALRLSHDADGKHYGLDPKGIGKISATVSIVGGEESSPETNEEYIFFDYSDESSNTYEIANARHLYNAGLHEKLALTGSGATYKITKDFAWGGSAANGSKGLLAYGESLDDESTEWVAAKFYDGKDQKVYTYDIAAEGGRTRYPAFPGIDKLNASGKLISGASSKPAPAGDGEEADGEGSDPGETRHTISNLALEPQKTDGVSAPGKVGLVRENNGTIQDLKLTNVDVRGIVKMTSAEDGSGTDGAWISGEDVGAFCGVNNGTLQNVETDGGTVTGGKNVGGIMGSIASGATVSGVTNGAEVSGVENVGGIVGMLVDGRTLDGTDNGNGPIKNTGIVYGWVLPEGSALSRIESEGATAAAPQSSVTAKYIGGIAGRVANGASIQNCTSTPTMQSAAEGGEAAAPSEDELQKYMYGDCVGGIAGYLESGAQITNCTVDDAASYVLGGNYVGGLVGWNQGTINALVDVTGKVLGYNFVGGVTGLNMSASQLANLSWNATDVTGNCFVGGYAGANIIDASTNVTLTLAADAGADNVIAKGAFAGGLFGYNRIVAPDKLAQLVAELQSGAAGTTESPAGELATMLQTADLAADGSGNWLSNVAASVFAIDENDKNAGGNASMTIQGNGSAEMTKQRNVASQIFAGGLLGYNASQTKLTISNYTGTAVVTAAGAVPGSGFESLGLVQKYGDGKNYSFSGGILGYVTENTTLENCAVKNGTGEDGSQTPAVTTPNATYLGGLAEINEGTIRNCSAAGVSGADYAGGLVGVNGIAVKGATEAESKYGLIEGCTMDNGASVSGHSIAGGLAAENYGEIDLSGTATMNGAVSTDGAAAMAAGADNGIYLGGVAGVNHGNILLGGNQNYGVILSAQGASNAGGIAGRNLGTIGPKTAAGAEDESTAQVTVNNLITGTTLGGVAGLNEGTIRNVVLGGSLSGGGQGGAEASALGGIAGINTGDGKVVGCGLSAVTVNLSGSGYVGGIAGRNSGNALIRDVISEKQGNASITSTGALATGGIAGVNEENATVENASSGVNWLIQSGIPTGGQGVGSPVGGLIGLHTSSEGLYGLTNLAGSQASGDGTLGVVSDGEVAGGIVGRVAVDSTANPNRTVTIQSCLNCGPVQAARKAGGIVGEWATNADGGIKGCFNGMKSEEDSKLEEGSEPGDTLATVSAMDTEATGAASAAGIVGGFNMTSGQVELLSCANFGVIEGSFGAGIAAISGMQSPAVAGGQTGPVVKLTDCANAGRNNTGAGIAVYHSGKAGNISLKLNRCRNYGRPDNDNEDGFAGLVACIYEEAGRAALDTTGEKTESADILIENSIGVADVKYPTMSGAYDKVSVKGQNVYYYSTDPEDENVDPVVIGTAGVGAATSWTSGETLIPGGELDGSRPYLAAVNRLKDETFNPNGLGYAQDCRGNYNRLELTLVAACLNLEKNIKADVDTTPAPFGLSAENNGGVLNITWKNRTTEGSEEPDTSEGEDGGDENIPDGPSEEGDSSNGVIYRAILELRLYDSKEEAEEDKVASSQEQARIVYTMPIYGDADSVSYNVRVNNEWMNKWARVSVRNYSYSNKSSTEAFCVIQILENLREPELAVSLGQPTAAQGSAEPVAVGQPTEGQPVYTMDLLNKASYVFDCDLEVTVVAEELTQAGEKEPTIEEDSEGTEGADDQGQTQGTEEQPQEAAGRTAQCRLRIPKGSFPFALTQGNMETYCQDGDAASGFFASSGTADVHLTLKDAQMVPTESSANQRAASAKKSFTALTLADGTLTGGVYKNDGNPNPKMTHSGNTVTVGIAGAQALYRTELLCDVTVGDYLLSDFVVAAKQQEIGAEEGIVTLEIPADHAEDAVHVRVYPLEMSGEQAKDGAKLGYLVASGLSFENLRSSAYVRVQETAAQPVATVAAMEQNAAPIQAQQAPAETEASQQEMTEQTPIVDTVNPVAADAQGDGTENIDAAEIPTAKYTMTVNDGYSIVRNSNGTFNVYYSELMKTDSPYHVNVWDQTEEQQQETATTSALGAGAAAPVAPAGDAPEDETEDTWEEETEVESEVASGNGTETEQKLPVPQNATLTPSWNDPGVDENGDPLEAVSEEYFRNWLMLTVDPVEGADGYMMIAGFYDEMPSGGGAPTGALLNDTMETYNSVTPIVMSAGNLDSFIFKNLPTDYAGKWLCAQFYAYTSDGRVSELSGYKWFRLPKVCLESPTLTRGTETVKHTMTTSYTEGVTLPEGITQGESEVELPHLALSWEQEKYDPYGAISANGERPTQTRWKDRGYTIDLYKLLDAAAGINTNSQEYEEPTAVVNLMRGGDSGSYYLERKATQEEQDQWKLANPDRESEVPDPWSVPVSLAADRSSYEARQYEDEEYKNWKTEFGADPKLENIYELALDKKALGSDYYSVDITQTVGDGTRTITGVCPILQIREYTDGISNEIVRIRYTLVLPDVDMTGQRQDQAGAQMTFLFDYWAYYCTHCVIVEPLRQSVFDAEEMAVNENIVANRTQSTYLVAMKTDGSANLENTPIPYQRILKPYSKEPNDNRFDKPLNLKDMDLFTGKRYDPTTGALLSRICQSPLIWRTGTATATIAQTDDLATLDANAAGEINLTFDEDGNMVFDTEQEETIDETAPTEGSLDLSADDIIMEEDVSTPEIPTEAQTSGQPVTEMWTDSSYETPLDLGSYDGEGY